MLVAGYFASGVHSIAISVSVCLSVCSHVSNTTRPDLVKFYVQYVWPWLDPPTNMEYVMYLTLLWMTSCLLIVDCMVLGVDTIDVRSFWTPSTCKFSNVFARWCHTARLCYRSPWQQTAHWGRVKCLVCV